MSPCVFFGIVIGSVATLLICLFSNIYNSALIEKDRKKVDNERKELNNEYEKFEQEKRLFAVEKNLFEIEKKGDERE